MLDFTVCQIARIKLGSLRKNVLVSYDGSLVGKGIDERRSSSLAELHLQF